MATSVRTPPPDHSAGAGHHGLIASLIDDGDAVLLLYGHLDTTAPDRIAAHLDELRQRGVLDITVRADGLVASPPELAETLARARDELTARHGVVRVPGLRPEVFEQAATG